MRGKSIYEKVVAEDDCVASILIDDKMWSDYARKMLLP